MSKMKRKKMRDKKHICLFSFQFPISFLCKKKTKLSIRKTDRYLSTQSKFSSENLNLFCVCVCVCGIKFIYVDLLCVCVFLCTMKCVYLTNIGILNVFI